MASTSSPSSSGTTSPQTKPNPEPGYEWLTTIPQEWFKLKVLGETLSEVIHSVSGYYVGENFEFKKEGPVDRNIVSPIRIITGREFVGVAPLRRTGIYRKEFQWGVFFPKTDEKGGDPVYEPKLHEKQIISAFPFVSNYPLIFSNVDIQGRSDPKFDEPPPIPISVKTIIRVRMLRPRVALMQNKDWLGSGVAQLIRGAILDFVKNKTYDQIVRKTELNKGNSEFRQLFLGVPINNGRQVERSRLRRAILEQYGVDLIDINIIDIDPNEKFEAQLQALANADIAAEILLRNARAEKEQRELQGQGEESYIRAIAAALQERLQKIRDTLGDSASVRAIEYAHALRDSKLTTLAGQGIGIVVGPDGQIR